MRNIKQTFETCKEKIDQEVLHQQFDGNIIVLSQAPNYPDSGRSWDIVDKYKVTLFYTAPTLVRSLMRDGNQVINLSVLTCTMCAGM